MKETIFKVCEKIEVFTYFFAWLTFLIFFFFGPRNPELYTEGMIYYLLYTPIGMFFYNIILENLNEIKDAKERSDTRNLRIVVVVYTLVYMYVPWKYFITSLFC